MHLAGRSSLTRRRALAGLGVAVLMLFASVAVPADEPAAETVKLVVDYGDGFQKRFTALPWVKGMTVLDVLNKAKAHPRGITFKHTGSGETAFLTQIDDVKNEGGGKDKKNWIYRVNDKLADRSCGVFAVKAGDEVVWKFDVYKP